MRTQPRTFFAKEYVTNMLPTDPLAKLIESNKGRQNQDREQAGRENFQPSFMRKPGECVADGMTVNQTDDDFLNGRKDNQQKTERDNLVNDVQEQRLVAAAITDAHRIAKQDEFSQYESLYGRQPIRDVVDPDLPENGFFVENDRSEADKKIE